MLSVRTAISHNAKMTAKIASTGALRVNQSASLLEAMGVAAAIVVMGNLSASIGWAKARANDSPIAAERKQRRAHAHWRLARKTRGHGAQGRAFAHPTANSRCYSMRSTA